MSSQSTKEWKAKENLVVLCNASTYSIKFESCCYIESIRDGMCAIHRKKPSKVQFIIYYDPESKDYYKPIKTNSAFNGNYIQYKSSGDKDKNLSLKEYLNMIKPYLSDIINDHKKIENSGNNANQLYFI